MVNPNVVLNIGTGTGQNRYKVDYSTADGAGITTQTCAQIAAGFTLSNIFYTDPSDTWVVMRADVDTDPIASNGYPRTETREMALDGTTNRAFNPLTGDHWARHQFKVIHLPPEKPSVVVLQIHDQNQDIGEFAVQPVTGYNKVTNPKVELVYRLMGTSSGMPSKVIADFQYNTVYSVRIRTGAIAPGSVAGWAIYLGDMETPFFKSWDAGMPQYDGTVSGANSYFKAGCYLQTKHTSNGTEGLETDVNEYGEVWFRELQTSHNGETAPTQLTYGTDSTNIISNVRWGAKAEGVNTTAVSFTLTPALPASLVPDDMVYCIARTRRTGSTFVVASPAIESVSPAWTRVPGTYEFASLAGSPGGTDLLSHSQRQRLWVRPWFSGMTAPVLTYTSTTATDIMSAQCFAIAGGKLDADEVLDQVPTAFTYGASSTTILGPTAALPANARGGALALALMSNEFNVPSGGATVVSGDSLTWAEGGEGVGTTVSFQAWANDWAIVPAGAGQAITAKQSANTARTTGKSASILLTLRPAEKKASGLIPAAG